MCAAIVLAGASAVLLRTDPGHRLLIRLAESQLSGPGQVVSIGTLGGSLPHEVRIGALRISDGLGDWLTVDAINVDWRPWALLSGRVDVARVEVIGPVLHRTPPPTTGSEDAEPLGPLKSAIRLRVESLAVEEGRLGAAIVGEPVLYRAAGGVTTDGSGIWEGRLLVERTDSMAARAEIASRFNALSKHLQLNATLSEPAGGVATRALGLPGFPALTLSVEGAGPLNHWRGQVVAEADSLAHVRGDITVSREPAGIIALKVSGNYGIDAPLADDLRTLGLHDAVFDVDVAWDGENALTLRQARVTTGSAQAEATGAVDLAAKTLGLAASIRVSGARLQALTLASGSAQAEIAATGQWSAPSLDLSVTLQRLRARDFELVGVDLAVQLTPVPGKAETFAASVSGRVDGIDLPDPIPDLLGEAITLEASAQVAPDRIQVQELEAASLRFHARGAGEFDRLSGAISASVETELDDLRTLSGLLPVALAGSAAANGVFERTDPSAPITGTLALTVVAPSLGRPAYDALLGREVVVSTEMSLQPADGINFQDFDIATETVVISGSAGISGGWNSIDTTFQAGVADLAELTPLIGVSVAGSLTGTGRLEGPLADPAVDLSVTSADLAIDGIALGPVEGGISLSNVGSAPSGPIRLSRRSQAGSIDLTASVLLTDDVLSASDVVARSGEGRVDGDIALSLGNGLLTGVLAGQLPDISPWTELASLDLGGAVEFDIQVRPQADVQVVELELRGTDVVSPDAQAAIGETSANATLALAAAGLQLDGTIRATGVRVGAGVELDTVDLTATGTPDALDLRVALTGPAAGGIDLQADGRVERNVESYRITVARLAGSASGADLELLAPTVATLGGDRMAIEPVQLTVAGGEISVSAELDKQSVEGTVSINDLPLSLAQLAWPAVDVSGSLSANGRLTGSRALPEAELRVDVADVGLAGSAADALPPGSGTARASWRDGRLQADGSFSSIGEPVSFEADLPLLMPASGLTPFVPGDEDLSVRIAWRGDIGTPWELLPVPDHRISGPAQLDLTVDGSLAAPAVDAALTLQNARYENLETGTLLTSLEASVRSADARIAQVQLSGKDGGDGVITADGAITLDQLSDPEMELTARFQDVTFLRRDEVTAAANGTISFAGRPSDARLSGQVDVSPAEIRLIASDLPPSVVDLAVIETGGTEAPIPAAGPSPAANVIQLDIDVTVPGRMFVRGRGLDSEWGGELHVTGFADAPVVTGQLRALRGDFTFAGKKFDLRDSAITFDGGTKIDPDLDIAAENAGPDIVAIVRVTGGASNPTIALESQPSLPQDEIVSRVLFGEDVRSLTALQAAQLGAAVASLTSGSTSILDRVRGTLGVDRFSVDAGEDGAAVSAGRYVGDRAFVGVRQGATAGSTAATVELEVLPNVTVESEVGGTGGPKTGVFWKRDY